MKLMNGVATIATIAIVGVTAALAAPNNSGGDLFTPVWVDSLKVNASGTGGRTAAKTYTITAGPDRVFLPSTIRFVESSRSGGGYIGVTFHEDDYVMEDVPILADGINYTLRMPQTITVTVIAETGSGPGNYNRGAWLNGHIHAETIPIVRVNN